MGFEVYTRSAPSNWDGARIYQFLATKNDIPKMAEGYTPMKQILKNKITQRRRNEGLNDINVDFTPKQTYPMTAEEIEKDEKRKQSNRKSAKKSRLKQKTEWDANEKILQKLQDDNKALLEALAKQESEKSTIYSSLMQYIPESKINEILAERVDYSITHQTSESVENSPGNSMDSLFARVEVSSGESSDSWTNVITLDASEKHNLQEFELTNDCFMNTTNSNRYQTSFVEEVTESTIADIGVADALDTVLFNNAENGAIMYVENEQIVELESDTSFNIDC